MEVVNPSVMVSRLDLVVLDSAAPWWVVPPSGHPLGAARAHYVPSGPKKIVVKFRCIWTPSDIDFLRCKKHAENCNWHLALCQ